MYVHTHMHLRRNVRIAPQGLWRLRADENFYDVSCLLVHTLFYYVLRTLLATARYRRAVILQWLRFVSTCVYNFIVRRCCPCPPTLPSQGNFAAVVVELCNCANCSVHKLKKSKCTAATRDTAQQDDNSSPKHSYMCTHVHTNVQESTCITGVTAKSSSARNESVTVINFYNGKELRATM